MRPTPVHKRRGSTSGRLVLRSFQTANVGSWSPFEHAVGAAAKPACGLALLSRPLQHPVRPVLPPRPGCCCAAAYQLSGSPTRLGTGEEVGLRVSRRVDQAGDVPRVGETKVLGPGEQLRGPIAAAPGREMVGGRARHVGVDGDLAARSTGVPSTVIAPGVASAFRRRCPGTGGAAPPAGSCYRRSRPGCRTSAGRCRAGSC